MIQIKSTGKINLGLRIKAIRPDGYHELETIFYPIQYPQDELRITKSNLPGIKLVCERKDLRNKDNLIIRVYNLFGESTGVFPPLSVELFKRIPIGAGLGGGSSNAAFFLNWLNKDAGYILSNMQLHDLAKKIGADVPFFLYDKPCRAYGIGEILEPVSINLNDAFLLLVCPQIEINTAAAFSLWDSMMKSSHKNSLDKLAEKNLTKIDGENKNTISCGNCEQINIVNLDIHNDLEEPVMKMYPGLAVIKKRIYELGAVNAAMSGSGSTIYGIFACKSMALKAAANLRDSYGRVYLL